MSTLQESGDALLTVSVEAGPPVSPPDELVGGRGTFTYAGGSVTMLWGDVDPLLADNNGLFSYTGGDASFTLESLGEITYTWEINEGAGTVVSCSQGAAFNGTVSAAGWATVQTNNLFWRINEGTGASLAESSVGGGTYDATIQNYTDNWG